MNTRAFTLALVIAGIAVFMVYTYIEDQRSALISRYGTEISVVVAKRDIKELELLDDTKVAIKTFPKNFASPGSFSTIKGIENTMATVPIMKGGSKVFTQVGHERHLKNIEKPKAKRKINKK